MPVTKELIRQCKQNNREAQKAVYEEYSSIITAICRRYVKDKSTAEDVMQETFITVFSKIDKFSGTGSFEGWIKRIAVNTSLMYIRKAKKELLVESFEMSLEVENDNKDELELNIKDAKSVISNAKFSQTKIIELIEELPLGFRTVFNMFVIEGYKHKEIADTLGISEGTSKSQLLRAKLKLQKILFKEAIKQLKKKR